MSKKQFISNLSSVLADIRKLDAKKINLKGKNILLYIEENTPTIKHTNDTRETVTENDLWGQWIETTADGTIIIHDDWVTNPNASDEVAWNALITRVEDNKAYVSGVLYGNILTEKIKNGYKMFYDCTALNSFSSDLSSLTNGYNMFNGCTKLTSFTSDLPSLTNGYNMFNGCTKLTSFTSDLPSLTYGGSMFYRCINLTSFSSDLPSLTDGSWMFQYCSQLTSFTSDLPSLTNGLGMFYNLSKLTSFSSDLPSLMNGALMFNRCTNFASFTSDLSSLTSGNSMFYGCTKLTSFTSDLPSLTYGGGMFQSCTNIESFSSDLSSLTYGGSMFSGCTNLTSFTSDLSSLTYGGGMFSNCKIDAESVMYIANTIKDITAEKQLYIDGTIPYITVSNGVYSAPKGFMSDGSYVYTYNKDVAKFDTLAISSSNVGKLNLGINVINNSSTIQQQLEDFAKEALFDSWAELKQAFVDKGWTVTFQYGGTSTSITLSEDEQFRGVPVYARLIEVSEEDKDTAEYCTEDGTKFYNIDWGHDVTDYDSYQYFGSLLEACGYFGVIPVKYLEEK